MVFAESNGFFESGTWTVGRNLALAFVALLWLATAFWTYRDARRRIEDPWLIAMATVLGVVPPFLGPIVYVFFRPPEYLEDVRERELEIRAMEERLARPGANCPTCRARVEPDYLVCPVCTTRLKHACRACGAALEPIWQACPYCTEPVPPAAVLGEARPLRPTRRRAAE